MRKCVYRPSLEQVCQVCRVSNSWACNKCRTLVEKFVCGWIKNTQASIGSLRTRTAPLNTQSPSTSSGAHFQCSQIEQKPTKLLRKQLRVIVFSTLKRSLHPTVSRAGYARSPKHSYMMEYPAAMPLLTRLHKQLVSFFPIFLFLLSLAENSNTPTLAQSAGKGKGAAPAMLPMHRLKNHMLLIMASVLRGTLFMPGLALEPALEISRFVVIEMKCLL